VSQLDSEASQPLTEVEAQEITAAKDKKNLQQKKTKHQDLLKAHGGVLGDLDTTTAGKDYGLPILKRISCRQSFIVITAGGHLPRA
jgi:hypothetical protein